MKPLKIETEVAGTVWKIVAQKGAQLAAGETILIMESMKMEIPIEAPREGKLAELHARLSDDDITGAVNTRRLAQAWVRL